MKTSMQQSRKYIWLFLLGSGGNLIGISLQRIQSPDLDFASGFLMGISLVAMGAYIYLAATDLRRKQDHDSGDTK